LALDYLSIEGRNKILAFFKDLKLRNESDVSKNKKLYIMKSPVGDEATYLDPIGLKYTPIDEAIGYERQSKGLNVFKNPDFSDSVDDKITLRGLISLDEVYRYNKSRAVTLGFDYKFDEKNNNFTISKDSVLFDLEKKTSGTVFRQTMSCFQIDSAELDGKIKYSEPVTHYNCSGKNTKPEILVFFRNSQFFVVERKILLFNGNFYRIELKNDES
jgi:hypothetical protein